MRVVERNRNRYSSSRWSLKSLLVVIRRQHLSGIAIVLFSCLWLLSCSGTNTPSTPGPLASQGTQKPGEVALKSVHWCSQPLMIFRDEGAAALSTPGIATPGMTPTSSSTPVTITDWAQVKQNLGFQVFLPVLLPGGSCLMSVYGTIHDSIFGSSFTIAYLLPDHTALSLSEAPVHTPQASFQCSISNAGSQGASTAAGAIKESQAVRLCSGVRSTTNIVFSAQWSLEVLQKFFQKLQADVEWQPVG